MVQAEVKWLRTFHDEREDQSPALTKIHIGVRSRGYSFAGVTEEYIYETTFAAEAHYERENIGEAIIERQPVTAPPHHWYWRRIKR